MKKDIAHLVIFDFGALVSCELVREEREHTFDFHDLKNTPCCLPPRHYKMTGVLQAPTNISSVFCL